MGSLKNERRKALWTERNDCGLCAYCGNEPKLANQRGCKKCAYQRTQNQLKFAKQRKDRQALYRKRVRRKVIEKYGGRCACPGCNETELLFLTIDHINGDGHEDRKTSIGTAWYMKLLREPLRNDLQVLCYNCNNGRECNDGICPHMLSLSTQNRIDQEPDLRKFSRFNKGNKFDWPSDEELLKEYREKGSRVISERLGCTRDAVVKRLQRRKLLEINHRTT